MKLHFSILAIIALCISSCSSNTDETLERMHWSHDNKSPENIKYTSAPDGAVTKLYLEVNYKGGDITLTCNNYDMLEPIGIDGSNTYDCGWGVFTVDGCRVICHFPEEASGREPASDHITISAKNGRETACTILHVMRSFGELVPDTDKLPDRYKFKLVKGGVTSFMNDDFGVPAPFDNISYRITDYYDRFQVFGYPEFTQYYDSIVWCADGFPNTLKVYELKESETSTEQHFSSQWSTHFFTSAEVNSHLKGYRDGKVVYSTSLTTYLYERDFLCYDWVEGSFAIANPAKRGIYCLLDRKYEYSALDTQVMNGTRYGQIGYGGRRDLPGDELLSYMRDALTKLMIDNVGQPQSAAGKTASFKCLPPEGVEAVSFWENKTTRILLLHKLPIEEYYGEKYYLHFEAK